MEFKVIVGELDESDIEEFKPFPGSPLWNEAKSMGIVSDEMDDWSEIESDDPTKSTTKFLCKEVSAECVNKYLHMTRQLLKRRAKILVWKNRFRKLGSFDAIRKFILKKIKIVPESTRL